MAMPPEARAAYDKLAHLTFLLEYGVAPATDEEANDLDDLLNGTCACGAPATMGTGECLECRLAPWGSEWQREQEDALIFGC